MTFAECEQLARQHGCTMEWCDQRRAWKVMRSPNNYGYITTDQLKNTSRQKFVTFYVPDQRR